MSDKFDFDAACDCGSCRMRRGEIDEKRFKDEVAETLEAALKTMEPGMDALLLTTALMSNMATLFLITLYIYGDGYNAGLEAGRKEKGE